MNPRNSNHNFRLKCGTVVSNYQASRLNGVSDTQPRAYLLSTILKEMQRGNATLADIAEDTPYRTLAEITERARELRYQHGNKEAYELLKKGMPQFTPAAVLETRSDVKAFSQLVCLEWDGDVDIGHAFVIGTQHPNVLAIWRSLSGNPKFLVPITSLSRDGDELTTDNFKHAWYSVSWMFEKIGDIDPSAMSPIQPQALCYDPDLFVNWDAVPVEWDIDEDAFEEAYPNLTTPENLAYAHLPVEYHIAIQEMDWRDDGWGKTRVPCPWGSHENDGWESRSNGTRIHKNGENDFTFQCFKCSDSTLKRYSETPLPQAPKNLNGIEPIMTLPPDHRSITSAPIGINERPVFPHFLPEDKTLIRACGYDPDASYAPHGNGRKPVWVTRYQKLYDATGLFNLNGQPKQVETYRVWNTLFETCPDCQKQTRAFWIDRFHLEAGTYCDTCHADIRTNSTLNLELRRKLTDSYTSTFEGFIGNDPFWKDTALWKPGRHTHLGAAMAQGKTTFIQGTGCEIATSEDKFFIICVPRISLALNIASKLNRQYGEKAFGIYYESSRHKYHGRIGAVCTLTSLPLLFQGTEPLDPQDCLIFIDEIDFSYPLNELVTPQARKVKTALRQALHANGLVTAGQTEYTAVIEAFAEEMETDDVFGYYKTAAYHEGRVQWIEYPDTDGKEIKALAGIAERIQEGLVAGQVVHAFTSERRQADVLAKMFESENPLVYSSLTKHRERNKKLLHDRKLTDTKLFIATSAADVGISIEDDRDSRTLILPTLLFGRIPIESATQETARVRGTQHIEIHIPSYDTALPLKPTETKNVFQHALTLKREIAAIEDIDFLTESRIATKKATTRTLRELAEQQPLTFVEHHLHRIAGYQIDVGSKPTLVAKSKLDEIRIFKKESLREETEKQQEYAEKVIAAEMERLSALKADPTTYLPASLQSATEIRQSAADGYITSFNLLGQRYVNELAVAIGFDDVPDRIRSGDPENPQPFDWNDADLPCIQNMVDTGIDATLLVNQMHGYIASRDSGWIQQHTETKLLEWEWTAVKDYRGIGTLARLLCEKLQGCSWQAEAFAMAIHETLHTETPTGTVLSDIKIGALGDTIYKKARFLFKIEDATLTDTQVLQRYTDFAIYVVETYLPVQVRKQTLKERNTDEKNTHFTLVDSNTIDVFEQALNCYLAHNTRQGREFKYHTVNRIGIPETETQKRHAEAIEMKKDGKTRQEIADATGLSKGTVSNATKGVTPTKSKTAERDAEIIRRYNNNQKQDAISAEMIADGYKASLRTVKTVIQTYKKVQKRSH